MSIESSGGSVYEAPRFPEAYEPTPYEEAAAERSAARIAINLKVLAGEQPSKELTDAIEHWTRVANDLAEEANV
ncbi:MAG TPA: hypothetical protein VFJ84_01440 [Candidatus Saccharimonadales bacterium]|nr:hypothetical protein [Candidatus Saccharimonadales bacterium]